MAMTSVFLRPNVSPTDPQPYPPINIPIKRMADNQPLSSEVSFKSHVAAGRTKEMQRISTASLALAQPQTKRSQ